MDTTATIDPTSATGRAAPRAAIEPVWNVPNAITLARLLLAVVVFSCVANGYYGAGLVVFSIAAITDALDGHIARKLGQVTALGRQLDPLVDKVIVCGVYIHLLTLPLDGTGLYPWMVTTIVVRELLIQGLRSHLEGAGQAFGARAAGKLKTLFQCLSISGILAVAWLKLGYLSLPRDLLNWAAVLLTIYSGLGYFLVAIPSFRSARTPTSPA